MGTGNYSHADGNTVTLNLYDDILENAEGDEDLAQILSREAFEDFQCILKDLLSRTSFVMDGESWRRDDRNCLILAENSLYQIWSHEDSYGHTFLTYGISEDIEEAMEPIAQHHLIARSEAFFDRLGQYFPLHVATSAWTSAPRKIPEKCAA
jgi:hypothetical protein